MDALWPDLWPGKDDLPPTDLFLGNVNTSLGRCTIARHPLAKVKVKPDERLPSGINMSYADGHAGRIALQDIKTPTWHVGCGAHFQSLEHHPLTILNRHGASPRDRPARPGARETRATKATATSKAASER